MRFVASSDLKPGMIVGKRVVNRDEKTLLEKGIELTQQYIDRLRSNGYMGIYIIDKFSRDIEIQETVSERTMQEAIEAVAAVDIGNILKSASRLVKEISSLKHLSVDLLDLRSFDDYTYHHSVNVAIYAVAVAIKLGLPFRQMNDIAIASLCHDLGKTKIDPEIINKPGRLTDEEFDEIRKHPQYSFDLLASNPLVTPRIREAVLYHHENENGSGYPGGRAAEEIPVYSKIIHAVDVFDALTSKRPYKDPHSPIDALEYLIGGVDILFDRKIVEAIQTVIPPYPPGMDVMLSNGEKAVVIGHTSQSLRPRIRIYETEQEVDLSSDLRYRMVFITASGVLTSESIEGIDTLNEGRSGKKKKILIVDDSKISLGQTRSALESDYEITTLESGTACLKYLEVKGTPDLLIMDIDMPVIDGVSTVEKIRETSKNLPVVFLTAIANRDTVIRCNKAGAKDYILKPVNPVYLKERIRIALDKNLER